jgi:hypothetical protein
MDKAAEAIRDQITAMMKNFSVPNFDAGTFIENQKRIIDAMSKAAQLTNEAATDIRTDGSRFSEWRLSNLRRRSNDVRRTPHMRQSF